MQLPDNVRPVGHVFNSGQSIRVTVNNQRIAKWPRKKAIHCAWAADHEALVLAGCDPFGIRLHWRHPIRPVLVSSPSGKAQNTA